MVTLCITNYNVKKFYIIPTHSIYVLGIDLRTNSDYFPAKISLRALTTDKKIIYHTVRADGLNKIKVNFLL